MQVSCNDFGKVTVTVPPFFLYKIRIIIFPFLVCFGLQTLLDRSFLSTGTYRTIPNQALEPISVYFTRLFEQGLGLKFSPSQAGPEEM